tara:strand:- start:101 stop:295 length:195 start_codon:yes stop_codon:yes gene_type:complete
MSRKDKDAKWTRTIEFTEEQQSVIVDMITYFNDMGWINESTQDAYDEVVEIICDDSPFEWSVHT